VWKDIKRIDGHGWLKVTQSHSMSNAICLLETRNVDSLTAIHNSVDSLTTIHAPLQQKSTARPPDEKKPKEPNGQSAQKPISLNELFG
jgi:hypothetical protein